MRTDLIAKLEAAAMLAEAAGEMPTAAILWTLIGALHCRQDKQLATLIVPFAYEALNGLDAASN